MTDSFSIRSKVCFVGKGRAAIMRQALQPNAESSGSFILTLASFLDQTLRIAPQICEKDGYQLTLPKSQPPTAASRCSFYELWSDLLFQQLCDGQVVPTPEYCLLAVPADDPFLKAVLLSPEFE